MIETAAATTLLAAAVVVAYLWAWTGAWLQPVPVLVVSAIVAGAAAWRLSAAASGSPEKPSPASGRSARPWAPASLAWAAVTVLTFSGLIVLTWPALLPPGGASDLTHHLMLVDVLERSRHLVDGAASEAALGEMAHYTPGLHLLIVMAGSLFGVEAYRTAYPLLALTLALKAGLLFLIAHDVLGGMRGRVALAVGAVGLVLFAPRAYSLDGFLQAGFYAQVASEVFVVAGWWAVARWWMAPNAAWMGLVGLMGAAVFLVWPIWIGPLMLAASLAVLLRAGRSWSSRVGDAALAVAPFALVAGLHLSQHAAWLRMAGTSGAVPAFVPGPLAWVLIALAVVGLVVALPRPEARVTLWFATAIALQALALWLLARARGAETPYMAMKMIYLAAYPAAVLGAVGLSAVVRRVPATAAAAWAVSLAVFALGLSAATAVPVPPPLVDLDLDAAGRWARANAPAACVGYVVDNAEQAYWLHLAVMGQPRSSPRTADLDGYTANRAVGRWLEGSALPYAVASRDLLPGEVLRDVRVLHEVGAAVVIQRPGVACPLPIAN